MLSGRTSDPVVQIQALDFVCSWTKHFTLRASISTQKNKGELRNCNTHTGKTPQAAE